MRKQRLVPLLIGGSLLAAGIARFAGGVENLNRAHGPEEGSVGRASGPALVTATKVIGSRSDEVIPSERPAIAGEPQELGPLDPRLRLVSRTSGELALLDRQAPETFLQAVLPPAGDSRHDPELERRVRLATGEYIRERTDVLRNMMAAYIETEGAYDFSGDLEQLREIDQGFRTAVTGLEDRLPNLARIPDVLGTTALPLPAFAEEAERAIRPEPEITFTGNPTTDNQSGEETHELEPENHRGSDPSSN